MTRKGEPSIKTDKPVRNVNDRGVSIAVVFGAFIGGILFGRRTTASTKPKSTHGCISVSDNRPADRQVLVSSTASLKHPPSPQSDNAKQAETNILTNSINWTDKVVAIATLGGVIVVCWQLCEMIKATNVTRQAITNATEQAIVEQRAWLAGGGTSLWVPYPTNNIGISVQLVNSGNTPADILESNFMAGVSKRGETNITEVLYSERIDNVSHIAPKDSRPIKMNKRIEDGRIDFHSLLTGQIDVHFHVEISYRDAFDRTRQTAFCRIVSGPAEQMSPDVGSMFRDCGFGWMR